MVAFIMPLPSGKRPMVIEGFDLRRLLFDLEGGAFDLEGGAFDFAIRVLSVSRI